MAQTKPAAAETIDIGSRIEMFVDRLLIDRATGLEHRLIPPTRREIVLTTDQPWESPDSAYFTVFRDGDKFKLYYRGVTTDDDNPKQTTCYAESTDGVHFTRPLLGIHEWNGSRQNNIVHIGPESAAFAPFLDSNPDAKPDEKYKAVAYRIIGRTGTVMAMASADGLRWRRMQEEPILPTGTFDSLNTAFWDDSISAYRMFGRYWTGGNYAGVRGIISSTSKDFLHWTKPQPNRYGDDAPLEHFYTNATIPCPGAEHHLLSFPMRFIPDRKVIESHPHPGISDAVFMSSRDGVNWDRCFREAWIRPGPDERNWTDRSNMAAWGIVQVDPGEFTMYVSEHYRHPDNRLRRITVRRHGFASLHAGADGGEFVTKPLKFSGKSLILNYATSAAGSVQVEILDLSNKTVPGFTLADMPPRYGDELDGVMRWKGGSDLSSLIGQPVRFRVVLKDADVYALRTGEIEK